MRINNNLMAMNTHRQLGITTEGGAKATEKLSSGYRINRAGDDAAGLAISEKMRGQIRGLTQASRNAQDGISLIQTAEGALNETHAILQRMRELAVQSATDTNTATDRSEIQKEIDQLAEEISRISNTTEFNTMNLMAGGLDNVFHIGANQNQNINLKIGAMDAHSLGVAASKIETSLTADKGITGIGDVTEDLGVGAKVKVSDIANATASASSNFGDITIEADEAKKYTGNEEITLNIVITQIDGTEDDTEVKQITVNGGAAIDVVGGTFTLADYDGIKFSIGKSSGNAVDKTGTITLKPAEAKIQLANEAGGIGDAVTVHGNKASVIVGESATDRTANIEFTFSDLEEGEVSITQDVNKSATAVTDALGNVTTNAKVKAGINVSTQKSADKAITAINYALETVSTERSKLGAMQNRLEHTIKNLDTSAENLQAAESRIRDVDMAKEMMEFTKQNILQQASTAMLAQANMAPQSVLQLLR